MNPNRKDEIRSSILKAADAENRRGVRRMRITAAVLFLVGLWAIL